MSFGDRVKEARQRAQISQSALARRAEMSLQGVAKIEQGGVTDPHYSTLHRLAEALDVNPLWLATGAEEKEPVPLGEASPQHLSPEEVAGGPNVEPLQEPSLLDDAQIVEWLRDHGLTWGTTDNETFSAHVRGLTLEEVDEDGRPVTVMKLGRALTLEQDSARDLLWSPSKYQSLDLRLSVDPNAPVAEQRDQWRDQLRKLRTELERRYRRRAYALRRYAELLTELLAEQEESATVSSIFQPRRVANTPEAAWDLLWEDPAA